MPPDEGTPPANPQLPGKRENTRGVCHFQWRTIINHEYLTNVHYVLHVCSGVSEGVCVWMCMCEGGACTCMCMSVDDRGPPRVSFLRNHPPYIGFYLYACLYLIWVYGAGNVHVTLTWMLRSEDNSWESILFFHHVSPGEGPKVIALGRKVLCPLSHLSGPPALCFGARSLTGTWDSLLLG